MFTYVTASKWLGKKLLFPLTSKNNKLTSAQTDPHRTYLSALCLWLLASRIPPCMLPQIRTNKRGTLSVPTLGKGETFVVFLFTRSRLILLHWISWRRGWVPIWSQGNLLNKVRHLAALRSKPNLLLVSREELCSLRLAVLNSITVFFIYLFLNRRQSTT